MGLGATLGMSRNAWAVAGVGVAALATGSAFAGTQYANRVDLAKLEPAPNAAVATTRPLVSFATPNAGKLTKLKVRLDGRDVSKSVGRDSSGRMVVATSALKEGAHTMDVTIATRNIFSRTVHRTWTFVVDTSQPGLQLTAPSGDATNKRAVAFAGKSEPGATITMDWKGAKRTGSATATTASDGTWALSSNLPEGRSTLRMKSVDKAGNTRTKTAFLTVDTVAPKLKMAKLPAKLTTDDPLLTGEIRGDTPDRTTIGAEINGREVIPTRVGSSELGTPTLTVDGNKFSMSMGALPQGKSTVKVFVRDPAGNTSSVTSQVMVDSTEDFGSNDLMPGAVGKDVKTLQEQLKSRGFKRIALTGVYDKQTEAAVKRYQKRYKLRQSGMFLVKTREKFVGRIVIDLSSFKLRLYRDGKAVMTFPIAVGMPAYPTPTGNYSIVNKQADPTWTPPPDSSWAKGLGPIPPGPGNPLGTRWIGTSAPLVGIHGTNAPSSIGTRASHGCIRMRIPDVEKLYEQVAVGMPVQMRQ